MKTRVNINFPDKVLEIMRVFINSGAEIYVVGGAIRDSLIGRNVYDWDFASNLTPDQMKKLFPKNSFCENKYGTFSIVYGKEIFEVTTYRTEREYSDNRHPDVVNWGKTIYEDLERRDFTINAMAIGIDGKIIDLFKGQEDLKNKLIRAVGDPTTRFEEDALRMIKAIRMAAELEFTIEDSTFEAIKEKSELLNNIAGERIRGELFRILMVNKPADAIRLLKSSGLIMVFMPEMLAGVNLKQKGHHIYDVWTHSLETLNNCHSLEPITRLACLFHDIGKPIVVKGDNEARTFHGHEVVGSRIAVKIGNKLRLSNKELDKLFRLVRWHMFTTEDTQTDKAVRRLIRNVTPEYLPDMIALRRADRLGSGSRESSWRWERLQKRIIEVQKQPFSVKDLKIDGNDVMERLRIKPSRKVGEVLEKIFKEVEQNPELNQREVLLGKISRYK